MVWSRAEHRKYEESLLKVIRLATPSMEDDESASNFNGLKRYVLESTHFEHPSRPDRVTVSMLPYAEDKSCTPPRARVLLELSISDMRDKDRDSLGEYQDFNPLSGSGLRFGTRVVNGVESQFQEYYESWVVDAELKPDQFVTVDSNIMRYLGTCDGFEGSETDFAICRLLRIRKENDPVLCRLKQLAEENLEEAFVDAVASEELGYHKAVWLFAKWMHIKYQAKQLKFTVDDVCSAFGVVSERSLYYQSVQGELFDLLADRECQPGEQVFQYKLNVLLWAKRIGWEVNQSVLDKMFDQACGGTGARPEIKRVGVDTTTLFSLSQRVYALQVELVRARNPQPVRRCAPGSGCAVL